MSNGHTRYRADIDGLRALAVLPVVLFHGHVPALRGGFVGVDVFFIISGFLICSVIGQELKRVLEGARILMPALGISGECHPCVGSLTAGACANPGWARIPRASEGKIGERIMRRVVV